MPQYRQVGRNISVTIVKYLLPTFFKQKNLLNTRYFDNAHFC
jgi:hypothetical protein